MTGRRSHCWSKSWRWYSCSVPKPIVSPMKNIFLYSDIAGMRALCSRECGEKGLWRGGAKRRTRESSLLMDWSNQDKSMIRILIHNQSRINASLLASIDLRAHVSHIIQSGKPLFSKGKIPSMQEESTDAYAMIFFAAANREWCIPQ